MLISNQADKKRLVEIIRSRGMFLYHACQLKDFASYLRLGGIPSRLLLERQRVPFTPFETDKQDRRNFVWDKVFVNLDDFGCWFAEGRLAIPNPYGPVQLRIRSEVVFEANDVSVSLRSAGGRGFGREVESLSIEEIAELYTRTRAYEWWPGAERIEMSAVRHLLERRYGKDVKFSNPEMSCDMPSDLIPIEHIDGLVVDPIRVGGRNLIDLVRSTIDESLLEWNPCILSRGARKDRKRLYQELADLLYSEYRRRDAQDDGSWDFYNLPCATLPSDVSDIMRRWIDRVCGGDLEWLLIRYCTYMFSGTIAYSQEM